MQRLIRKLQRVSLVILCILLQFRLLYKLGIRLMIPSEGGQTLTILPLAPAMPMSSDFLVINSQQESMIQAKRRQATSKIIYHLPKIYGCYILLLSSQSQYQHSYLVLSTKYTFRKHQVTPVWKACRPI